MTSCRARELSFIASAGCCCGDSIRRVKEKGSSTIVNGSLQPVPFTHSHKAFNNPFCPNEITSLVSFPSHRATRHISSHLRFLSLVLSSTLWCSFFICLHSFSLSLSTLSPSICLCVCVCGVWVCSWAKWLISDTTTCSAWRTLCTADRQKMEEEINAVGFQPRDFPFCLPRSNKRPSAPAAIRGLRGEGGEGGSVFEIVHLLLCVSVSLTNSLNYFCILIPLFSPISPRSLSFFPLALSTCSQIIKN